MKKNEKYIGVAEGYTNEGAAIVKVDGVVLFVNGLIIGEEAEIAVTAMKKNYGYARVVKILKESSHRVEAKCSVSRLCGGCTLQMMDDEAQKYYKEDKVKNCFKKNAGIDVDLKPIIRVNPVWNYRNKVQVPVQMKENEVKVGFYRNHSNDVIPFETCMVQTPCSNDITNFFKKALQKYQCGNVFKHLLIKHAHTTDEVMVVMIVREYPFNGCEELTKELLQAFPNIKSIEAMVNQREDNVILDGKEILIYGQKYIEEELLGCRFRISARSFYQINPYATKELYSTAIDYAKLTNEDTLIDLYCGTGTMGIIGAKKAKQVYGIEIVADAIKDAQINADENNVHNIEFMNADAGKGAQMLIERNIKANAMIVDPPRKGCSKDTLEAILTIGPERLVYVSCDPATLARDVKFLLENNYKLEIVQPVDMFPQTTHVETIVLLNRK